MGQILNWFSTSTLMSYIYCMLVSYYLFGNVVFAVALYMFSRAATLFMQTIFGKYKFIMNIKSRIIFIFVMIIVGIFLTFVIMSFPLSTNTINYWVAIVLVFSIILMQALQTRLIKSHKGIAISKTCLIYTIIVFYTLFLTIACIFLIKSTANKQAIILSALLALVFLAELLNALNLVKYDIDLNNILPQNLSNAHAKYMQANAYKTYSYLSFTVLLSIQFSALIIYSFIAVSIANTVKFLFIFVLLTFLIAELARFINKGLLQSNKDYTNWLYWGLFLIAYSIWIFNSLGSQSKAIVFEFYVALVIGSLGSAICLSCLSIMEKNMANVAKFISDDVSELEYRIIRNHTIAINEFMGQFLAFIVLAVIMYAKEDMLYSLDIFYKLKPLLILPAIALVIFSILVTIKFPLSERTFKKLGSFLHGDLGTNNKALKKHLDKVLIKKHKKRIGVKIIMAIFRPLFYHKRIGLENIKEHSDGTMIFISNHGEVYGPVVANLYLPCTFRPWIMSELFEKESFIAYTYKYTFSQIEWIPKKYRMKIAQLAAPLMIWLANSVEGIPVYRNEPDKLIKTFRESMEAMQSGDNLLIFPEDPNAQEEGYLRKGIGEFYTGFTAMGRMYYSKTKKPATFIPVYANKELRTISIGKGIMFDPQNNDNDEKLRIVAELRKSMFNLEKQQYELKK